MATKYIINNEDGLITTGQTINGGISATTISADTLIISGSPIPQPSYKVYTALLTQTGTSAPVATVLENTIGNISFTYDSLGNYVVNFSDSIQQEKTWYSTVVLSKSSNGSYAELMYNTTNSLSLSTGSNNLPSDDMLYFTPIEIRVYN